jgi:hypothetical protein
MDVAQCGLLRSAVYRVSRGRARARLRCGALLLVVAALVVSGCSAAQSEGGRTADRGSVPVGPGESGFLALADGLRVNVPADSVAGAGTLNGAVVGAPAAAPAGMIFAGRIYHFQISGTRLTGRARLKTSSKCLPRNWTLRPVRVGVRRGHELAGVEMTMLAECLDANTACVISSPTKIVKGLVRCPFGSVGSGSGSVLGPGTGAARRSPVGPPTAAP